MAPVINTVRTCGLLMYLFFYVYAVENNASELRIMSLKQESKMCGRNTCKYLLNLRGGEFLGHYSWRLTLIEGIRGGECEVFYPNYEIREVMTTQWMTTLEIILPLSHNKLYFCLYKNDVENSPFSGNWTHQGAEYYLDVKSENAGKSSLSSKQDPLEEKTNPGWSDLSHDIDVNRLDNKPNFTRKEREDVEILQNDTYVPLKDIKNLKVTENDQDFVNFVDDNTNFKSNRHANELIQATLLELDQNFVNVDENFKRRSKRTASGTTIDLKQKSEDLEHTSEANLELAESEAISDDSENTQVYRRSRQVTLPEMDFTSVRMDPVLVKIEGLRIEDSDKEPKIIEDGIPSVLADSKVTLRLFGDGLTTRTVIAFTHELQQYGQPCKFLLKGEYMIKEDSLRYRTALFEIIAPTPIPDSKLYICAKNLRMGVDDPFQDEEKYLHQGTESFKMFASHNTLLPIWVSLTLILTCLTFSALFSGLNLGLMSLDRTELKIISNTGTEQERKYARAIMPVRDHGNYLLCSILLGNVAVNSTFTILLDELTSGLFAVIFSTLAIVLLGEITPQAICSRHGLMVGAKSIMVTKAVMALTAPLAFPVSKLLDYFLGEEIGNVYNRERLKELVKVTTDINDLDKDEVNIISGALELRKKTVSSVMTKLEDVFMLPISSVLDFETMSEIIKSGYSRIPVYEGSRGNIVTVLFIKDLAFVDPDDNTPLRTLCQYYQNPCNFVFEDVTLDVMFKQFKDGHKGHMAFVHRINNEGEGDPFYETIGLVTLEDVIEEMIQSEIVDETDVFMDNRTKRRRNKPQHKLQDFAAFAERHENQRIHISPQLTLATFQFLSTSVDAFRPDTVSETVLRRLLRQDVIHYIKLKGKTKKDPSTYVFQQGKPVDYFVLILEGRVEVTVGRENLVFEAGPFTYFGSQALTQNVGVAESPTPSAMGSLQNINMDSMLRHTFVPDYSVRAITELYYLTVKRSLYLAAKRATLMEKGALSKGATNEQFDTEVDKNLFNSSHTNIPISLITKKLIGISASTASSKNTDDMGSTSHDNKLQLPHLMEFTQRSKEANSDQYLTKSFGIHCSSSNHKLGIISKSHNDVIKTTGEVTKVYSPSKSFNDVSKSDYDNDIILTKSYYDVTESINDMTHKYYLKDATKCCKDSTKTYHDVTKNNYDISEAYNDMTKSFNDATKANQEVTNNDYDMSEVYNEVTKSFNDATKAYQEVTKNDYDMSEVYNDVTKNFNDMTKTATSSYANACDTAKYLANFERSSKNNFECSSKHLATEDALNCPECVKNNFWMNKTVLNKSIEDPKESDHCKKKKTTFHTDSSLISVHNHSLSQEDTQNHSRYKSNEFKSNDIQSKSNIRSKSNDLDNFERFFEFEREIEDDREYREERLAMEMRRLETEQLMLVQLSKIINMLERKQN